MGTREAPQLRHIIEMFNLLGAEGCMTEEVAEYVQAPRPSIATLLGLLQRADFIKSRRIEGTNTKRYFRVKPIPTDLLQSQLKEMVSEGKKAPRTTKPPESVPTPIPELVPKKKKKVYWKVNVEILVEQNNGVRPFDGSFAVDIMDGCPLDVVSVKVINAITASPDDYIVIEKVSLPGGVSR